MSQFTDVMDDVQSACSDAAVATVAGVAAFTWNSLHVFMEGNGLIGGRNRGRIPFVEIISGDNTFDWIASEYSTTDTFNIIIRVWVGGKNRYAASSLSQEISRAILGQFKNYPRLIDKQINFNPITIGPLGFSADINVAINLSNDENFG